jgi:hypothetical protein
MKPLTHPFGEEALDPIEIDPRPCVRCGRTIDRHEMFDNGNGPVWFCVDDGDADFQRAVDDIVRRLELGDPRDAWRHTGELPPPAEVRNSHQKPQLQPYRTPQSVVDAFWYVVGLNDADRLKAWLAKHPKDAPTLLELLEGN